MMTSVIEYVEDPMCLAHDSIERWLDAPTDLVCLADLIDWIKTSEGLSVHAVYLSDDLIWVHSCPSCGQGGDVIGLRPLMGLGVGRCESCGAERPMDSRTALEPEDPLMRMHLTTWLWPRSEVVALSTDQGVVHCEVVATHA